MPLLEAWPSSCRQDGLFHMDRGPLAPALHALQHAPASAAAQSPAQQWGMNQTRRGDTRGS